jgi:hypothetical protein
MESFNVSEAMGTYACNMLTYTDNDAYLKSCIEFMPTTVQNYEKPCSIWLGNKIKLDSSYRGLDYKV